MSQKTGLESDGPPPEDALLQFGRRGSLGPERDEREGGPARHVGRGIEGWRWAIERPGAWDEAGRYLAGSVILGGALYQLTRPKDAFLRRCRDARGFLGEHWRPGRAGALRMGAERGGFCVACCWGLMAALFAPRVLIGARSRTGG